MCERHLSRRQFAIAGVSATVGGLVLAGVRRLVAADPTAERLAFTAVGDEYRFDTGTCGMLRSGTPRVD